MIYPNFTTHNLQRMVLPTTFPMYYHKHNHDQTHIGSLTLRGIFQDINPLIATIIGNRQHHGQDQGACPIKQKIRPHFIQFVGMSHAMIKDFLCSLKTLQHLSAGRPFQFHVPVSKTMKMTTKYGQY